ncbi:hypothetical protein [Pedobacter zeae]|uniref:DUF4440 domain-containing protein n=1 Tax=Pedobacter zeae TaxID=1737356 RepID=A0A7W6P890_9SPHI|nr:hypothetical protein [Pedobacter zeae]MBB4109719.1 hypothetical protein [Pedobacter zeae]GGH13839.1 hypothetical protein GCM10007422_34750 [Pedobacter zeae]
METDLILSAINELHQKANQALENKDVTAYTAMFGNDLSFTPFEKPTINKRDFTIDLKKYFSGIKEIQTSHYRIKSSVEGGIFTEKIARKSVILKPKLLVFTKKQTIQTEEIYHWKISKGEWKVIALEIVLEEKY